MAKERLPIVWPGADGSLPVQRVGGGGAELEKQSLVEKALDSVGEAVSGVGSKILSRAGEVAGQAVSTVGVYAGAVPSAILVWAFKGGFWDVDKPGFDFNGLTVAKEIIEVAPEQERKLIEILRNQGLAQSLGRQILIEDAAWNSKVGKETDITEKEEYEAHQAVEQMLDGVPENVVIVRMENDVYGSRVRRAVETVAASVVLFNQARVLERMTEQSDNEAIIFDVPPLPLLLGAVLTGKDIVATVQSVFVPHQGGEVGAQILLLNKGAEGYSVVVRRGSSKKGGMDEYTSRAQIEWKESGSYMALTDSKFGGWLRKIFKTGEVEVGYLEIANPGRDDSVTIPVATKGKKLEGAKMGPASLVRNNIAVIESILEQSKGLVDRSRKQMVEELELMRESGELKELSVRQVLEKLLAEADESVDSSPRVSVIMWRARQIYKDIMKRKSWLQRVGGQASVDIDALADEIFASVEISEKKKEVDVVKGETKKRKGLFAGARERRKKVREDVERGRRLLEEDKKRKSAGVLLDQAGSIIEQYAEKRKVVDVELRQDLANAVETLGVEETVNRLMASGMDEARVIGVLMLTGMNVTAARNGVRGKK